jgi:hypothetical protein
VQKDFLMAVLNEAVMQGRPSIAVTSNLLDIELVGANLESGQIDFIAQQSDFDAVLPEIQSRLGDQSLIADLPTYTDLRDAFQSSLLLPPENLSELIAEMKKVDVRRKDPFRYPKQLTFAVDTNILYDRLLSRLLLTSEGCGIKDYSPDNIQILLASLVEEEASLKVGRKYSGYDIDALKKALRNPKAAGALLNCVYKDGRKALNAQAEIAAIKERYNLWQVAGGEFTEDKERRDAEILKALAKHAANQGMDLLFITADDKARTHALTYKVPSIHLKYGYEVPRLVPFDPYLFVELLYDLAIVFATISFKGLGLRVLGDWSGKNVNDYRLEKVKLVSEEGSSFAEWLEKDYRVISRLQQKIEVKELS